jgi:hypothetical protein
MDLWDVVRLIVRRWPVSTPLILLTAAAVAWTAVTITPHHSAEGSVLLLPPTVERSVEPGQPRNLNPWDTHSMTGAMVTMLQGGGLRQQLEAEGFDVTWEAGRDLQFASMITIVVTADTERQAQEAVSRLTEIVTAEVAVRQQSANLVDGETITAVTLAAGENISLVRSNQMRALIVLMFAGGLLTVLLTISADALLRARAARRTDLPPTSAVTGRSPLPSDTSLDSTTAQPADADRVTGAAARW